MNQLSEARTWLADRIRKEPDADFLLDVLGLTGDNGLLIIDGQTCCPACRKPYRQDGRTACRREGCGLGPKSRFTRAATDDDATIARAYADGATVLELARYLGVAQDTVRQAILRAGGQMRRPVRRPVTAGAR